MNNLRQYEKDERPALRDIYERMWAAHDGMGGRTNRPERRVLRSCAMILRKLMAELDKEALARSSA